MIIGITGKSGAGKSYIGKEIANRSDKFVYINMDFVLQKYFRNFFNKDLKKLCINEKIKSPIGTLSVEIAGIFKKNNILFDIYSIFFLRTINRMFKKNEGKIFIIDSLHLPAIKSLNNKCDIKILIDAEQNIRLDRVLKRKNISEKDFFKRESHNKYLNFENEKFDMFFDNTNPNNEKTQKLIQNLEELILEKQNANTTAIENPCLCKE